MSCPAPEQLAAAATEGDDAILAHAVACASCLHTLDAQRSSRALAQRTPPVVLSRARREAIAAEVMAQADRLPAPAVRLPVLTRERREAMAAELMAQSDRIPATISIAAQLGARRRTAALVVAGLAAAATVVIVVALRGGTASGTNEVGVVAPRGSSSITAEPIAIQPSPPASVAPAAAASDARAPDPAAPAARGTIPRGADVRAIAKLAGSGDYARDAREATTTRDVVRLRGGELTVDSTGSRPVEIVSGDTAIAVHKARVKVIARHGVVASVAVFAGSAEVTVDGHRVSVEAGTVWERDVARDDALAAFRTGWTALRAGDHSAAIAAFDRATDPTVAEDATYWAAIASERAGDAEGALRRYRDLLARFPNTTRATEARAALARLAP